MRRRTIILATIAALAAQVIFGFSFMFTKVAIDYASPMTVIANRYMVAFLAITVVIIAFKIKIRFDGNMRKLILMSCFQPILYFVFETYGIAMTTSAFSSVMISLIPVASMICGIFMLKEIPTPMQYVFTVLSVVGVVIMAVTGSAEGVVTPIGILFLLGAVISSVGYNIMSRKISDEFTAFERTYAMMIIGMIFFVTVALVENIHNPLSLITSFSESGYVAAVIYLGVISSVVAFLLLNYANTHLPVAKTTVFSNITTAVSVIAGAVYLKEELSAKTIIAVMMIVVGVWGVQLIGIKWREIK